MFFNMFFDIYNKFKLLLNSKVFKISFVQVNMIDNGFGLGSVISFSEREVYVIFSILIITLLGSLYLCILEVLDLLNKGIKRLFRAFCTIIVVCGIGLVIGLIRLIFYDLIYRGLWKLLYKFFKWLEEKLFGKKKKSDVSKDSSNAGSEQKEGKEGKDNKGKEGKKST